MIRRMSMAAQPPAPSPVPGIPHGRDRLVTVCAALVFLVAAVIAVVCVLAADEAETAAEVVLRAAAISGLVAAPGVLVLLARADRPSLLVTAGVALLPVSMISFAGLALPVLIPALVLLVAGARRADARPDRPCAPMAVTTLVVLTLVVGAGLALFAHDDPRSWQHGEVSGSTSDVVTVPESLLSLGLGSLAICAAWYLATPVTRRAGDRARDSA
jgi:hypothetical protein